MSKRQSVRSKRRSVNYSKLNQDSDSEDDFATSTPPTKKTRLKQKKRESPSNKKQKNKRLPDKAEDKFSRELEEAVKLSLASQQSSDCDQTKDEEVDTDSASTDVPGETYSPLRQNTSPPDKPQSTDCRVSDETIPPEINITKGKDNDYELSDDSPSDDAESDHSIENQPPTKTKKVFSKRKVEKVQNNLTNPSVKSHNCENKNKSKRATNREVYKPPSTNTFSQPRWQPPGQAGLPATRSNLQRSPASLRIGLSRNARLTPLHKT